MLQFRTAERHSFSPQIGSNINIHNAGIQLKLLKLWMVENPNPPGEIEREPLGLVNTLVTKVEKSTVGLRKSRKKQ